MIKSKKVLLAVFGWSIILASQSPAQVTNLNGVVVPATILETLESTTSQVIIKGTAPVGTVNSERALVSVVCKEDTLASTGHKEYGIMVGITFAGQPEDRTVIDYGELDSLLSSLDYLNKVNWSVTALTSFDASYTTKAGLRVAVFSSKHSGQIEFSLRSSRMFKGIVLAPDQWALLRSLIAQAKAKLDAIRNG